MFSRLL
jgi:hypothetical protein